MVNLTSVQPVPGVKPFCAMNASQPKRVSEGSNEIPALRERLVEACSTRDALQNTLRLSDPQQLLDDFQTALNHKPIPPKAQGTTSDRARLIKALIHLSVSSELFPSSLKISQVQKEKDPVDFGISGEVYRGHLPDRTVAVKVFKSCKRTLKDLLAYRKVITTEAIIWCQLYHKNIVPCYGAHCDPAKTYRIDIVSPWMENGNIPKYLRANENAEPPINRVLLLSDIASGMAYLHSNDIVHGDLKAANVLVSASHRACLTDFGLSTTSQVSGWTSPPKMRAPGAPRWHAPELSDPRNGVEIKITTMSDVYSFGNVCYEIMTGKLPLYETKNNTRVQLRVLRGDRPSKPALQDPAFRKYGLTEDIWNFIQACWLQEPEQRPTAKDLCEHPVLSSLADHRPSQEWGEGSIVDFRSRPAPSPSSKLPNLGSSISRKPLPIKESAERASQVDGFGALAEVVEAVGEGHCPVSTIRAHLLRVLASEDMRQEMLRLGKARSEKWVDAFQMVLDSDPSNTQGDRGRFMEGLLCLSIARGEHPKALQLKVPVEKEAEPVDMGPSGELYRGHAFGGDVAIKVLKTYRSRNRIDFMKVMLSEVIISCHSQHPNILPCYGIYNPQSQVPVRLVSPWMGNGNVGDYLRGNRQANRLLLVSDVAAGLSYLHDNGIVHGDLQGANVLVSASGRACISNFSLSTLFGRESSGVGLDFGAVRWQAPELFANLDSDEEVKITTKSDVYSFGCVSYEIMTGKIPFYQIRKVLAIPTLVLAGIRPHKPDAADPAYQDYGLTERTWSFIETCWQQDAELRPAALELRRSALFSSVADLGPMEQLEDAFRRQVVPSE